jgi:hypothetical protein
MSVVPGTVGEKESYMPIAEASKEASKKRAKTSESSELHIVFSGPLLFIPQIESGRVVSVDVYSPRNGHPIGAVFLPGVFYSDAELDKANPATWPEQESFSLLDPHSYAIEVTHAKAQKALLASEIPKENHKIKPGRKLTADWDVAISIYGQVTGWSSHRHFSIDNELYRGSDAPMVASVAGRHRLKYARVAAAEFCGARKEPKAYLSANIAKGGTLIIMGEIPYQPSLLHERRAIDSLAKLAGLDLQLATTEPEPHKSRLMLHTINCGHSIILA